MQLKNLFIDMGYLYAQIWKKKKERMKEWIFKAKLTSFLESSNKLDYHNNRSMGHILNWEKIPAISSLIWAKLWLFMYKQVG